MTRRKNQDAPVVISVRGPNGRMTHTPVSSQEGQGLVRGVLNRVAFLRENGDEDVLSMDEVLDQLGVPEEHWGEAAELLSEDLNSTTDGSTNYYSDPIPRDLIRDLHAYEGSWLERALIERHTFFEEGYGLRYLAQMVRLLAESYGKYDYADIHKDEVEITLLNLAGHIRMAANHYEPEKAELPEAA